MLGMLVAIHVKFGLQFGYTIQILLPWAHSTLIIGRLGLFLPPDETQSNYGLSVCITRIISHCTVGNLPDIL